MSIARNKITTSDKLYRGVCDRFEQIAALIKLDAKVHAILSQPKAELMIHFPVKMNDGRYKLFTRAAAFNTTTCWGHTKAGRVLHRMCGSTKSKVWP